MALSVQTYDQVAAAAQALAADRAATFFGGGTLVMRQVNEGDMSVSTIVRTTDTTFRTIRPEGNRLLIGAGVTMAQVMASSETAFLADAARAVGSPQIRNMATVGGNLFAPSPYGDFATALLALEAKVLSGGRETDLEEFFNTRNTAPSGLVEAIAVSRPQGVNAFRFLKVRRTSPKGASVMAIAAHLPQSGGGVSNPRIAYGAMGPTPVRALAVERALEGRRLTASDIGPALAAATDGITPPTDAIASEWYRREVAPVHLRRLLLGEGGA